jgi:hypothetical protein
VGLQDWANSTADSVKLFRGEFALARPDREGLTAWGWVGVGLLAPGSLLLQPSHIFFCQVRQPNAVANNRDFAGHSSASATDSHRLPMHANPRVFQNNTSTTEKIIAVVLSIVKQLIVFAWLL